jgi:preprotein translocase SecE subunit
MAEVQNVPQQGQEMPHIPPVKKPDEPPKKGLLAEAEERAKVKGERKQNRVFRYFVEVRDELKKVEWPGRKETIRGTLIVLGLGIFVAGILGAFDVLFSYILQKALTIF